MVVKNVAGCLVRNDHRILAEHTLVDIGVSGIHVNAPTEKVLSSVWFLWNTYDVIIKISGSGGRITDPTVGYTCLGSY